MLRKDFKCLEKIDKMPMLTVAGFIVLQEYIRVLVYYVHIQSKPHWNDMLLEKKHMSYGRLILGIKFCFYIRV
jgi:hypothetical protein